MDGIKKGNLQDPDMQKFTIYNDGELALSRNIHDIELHLPIQMEMHAIVLVLEGKGQADINGTTYKVNKNDLLICSSNHIVEKGLLSVDFRGCFIFASENYVRRLLPIADHAWDYKMLFDKHPVCTLLPEEVAVFCQYYDLLCAKMQQSPPAPKRVIDTLTLAFFYDMESCLTRVRQTQARPTTAGQVIFQHFINLLTSMYPKPRSVTWYAGQLHITPKYLSSVCKQVGGQRPRELIDLYMNKDIEFLLKHTQKTVKEIAYELDFPSLSFFGKYMRRNFGLSPKAYREKALCEEKQTQED